MPQGGRLTIETARVRMEPHSVGRGEIGPGAYVLICVSDTGCGMTSEILSRAFDPFFTTKPLGEGTGLGLSQVFGFVTQSGGYIRLHSDVGRGTTVKIYLPALEHEVPVETTETASAQVRAGPGEVILVVEDDEDVRTYSTETLRELGFTVLEARDGASALRVLEHHAEVRLLFTDVGLPGINGRQLFEEVRERWPEVRVLFTSGYERNALMHGGRLESGVAFLAKPFTRERLASRVRSILDAPAE